MVSNDFRDIKVLENAITNRSSGMSKARVLVVSAARKFGFFMRNHYNLDEPDNDSDFVSLVKGKKSATGMGKGRGRPKELLLQNISLPLKFPHGKVLKPAKTKDLEALLPFYHIEEDKEWMRGLVERQKVLSGILQEVEDDDQDINLTEDPDNPDDHVWADTSVFGVNE